MPTFMFEAIDAATGKEIRDTVDATNADEAQATIRSMGYMVTKIKAQKKSAQLPVARSRAGHFRWGKSSRRSSRSSRDSFRFFRMQAFRFCEV